jgi:hypothetical protein
MLVLVTLFCVWGGFHSERAQRERRAAAILRERGATLVGRGRSLANPIGWYEAATKAVWGEQFLFYAVVRADMTDEEAAAVASLPHLTHLHVRPFEQRLNLNKLPQMAPGTLARILGDSQLEELAILNAKASPGDCDAICRHETLKMLVLAGIDLSGGQFAQLLELPKLETLEIARGTIAMEAPVTFVSSTTLHTIELASVRVNRHVATALGRCRGLRQLLVLDPSVNDEFIHELRSHPSLEALGIPLAEITDACVVDLASCPKLSGLGLRGSPALTDRAKDQLKRVRPGIDIQ